MLRIANILNLIHSCPVTKIVTVSTPFITNDAYDEVARRPRRRIDLRRQYLDFHSSSFLNSKKLQRSQYVKFSMWPPVVSGSWGSLSSSENANNNQ